MVLKLEMRQDQECVYLDVSNNGDYKGFMMYDTIKDTNYISPTLKEFLRNEVSKKG